MATLFKGSDDDYLDWLKENPDGFVVNLKSHLDESYAVLHRAGCGTISIVRANRAGMPAPGGFTERGYLKLCAETIAEAQEGLARRLNKADSVFSKRCSKCRPA